MPELARVRNAKIIRKIFGKVYDESLCFLLPVHDMVVIRIFHLQAFSPHLFPINPLAQREVLLVESGVPEAPIPLRAVVTFFSSITQRSICFWADLKGILAEIVDILPPAVAGAIRAHRIAAPSAVLAGAVVGANVAAPAGISFTGGLVA